MSILKFIRGEKYSRADVKEVAGLSRHAKGGPWDTGVAEHNGELLIFANVKTVGRTGHDYPNIWEGNHLRWYHKNGSTLGWPSVKKMLGEGRVVHVFWRNEDRAQFEYAGVGTLIDHKDTSPVEVLWSFNDATSNEDFFQGPDEITPVEYREGATRQVTVNAFQIVTRWRTGAGPIPIQSTNLRPCWQDVEKACEAQALCGPSTA